MSADDLIIERIIEREGGFVDHPSDRGGPTKFGITLNTLSEHRGGPVTAVDVEKLSVTEARDIYRERYVEAPGFHLLGSEVLRGAVVDFAVTSGPTAAIKALQRCLNVKVDGIIGGETVRAANLKDGTRLAVHLIAERQVFVAKVVANRPDQVAFLVGWTNRNMDQIKELV